MRSKCNVRQAQADRYAGQGAEGRAISRVISGARSRLKLLQLLDVGPLFRKVRTNGVLRSSSYASNSKARACLTLYPRGTYEGGEIALGGAKRDPGVIRPGTSSLLPCALSDAFQGIVHGLIQDH